MSRPAFIYLLKCSDGSIYTGWSFDVTRRVLEHQSGRAARYTRTHLPVKLIYQERLRSRRDAMRREIEIKRWWPAGREDGEPDMPHDTYFDREFPLYIDYGDYDRQWLVPADSDQKAHFMETLGETPVSTTEKLIEPWRKADSVGICSPKVLAILNAIFKKHYIREEGTREQLLRLYEQAAERVTPEAGIPPELFMTSPFVQWPLYHFV